jgi:predicted DNA-binding transcriptional regulator AlpA
MGSRYMGDKQTLNSSVAASALRTTAPLDDKILIPDEVALLLRVKVDTLYRWRLDGDGPPFVRMGRGRGRIGYRKSDLDQYIADNVRRSTSQEAAA